MPVVCMLVLIGVITPKHNTSPNLVLATAFFNVGGTRSPFVTVDPTSISSIDQQLGLTYPNVTRTEIPYPATIWPLNGLDSQTLDSSVAQGVFLLDIAIRTTPGQKIVEGGSQGAVVATVWENTYANRPDAPAADQLSFVLFGNPSRPNGGLLERFAGLHIPIVGITAIGATPSTQYKTIDIAREYDGFANFPAYPLNLIADLNAIAGAVYIHPNYNGVNLSDPANRVEVVGNTTYITIPTEHLPLLQPLRQVAAALGRQQTPLLDAIEPVLKNIVDAGYVNNDPMGNPGTPTPAKLFTPSRNLVTAGKRSLGTVQRQSAQPHVRSHNTRASKHTRSTSDHSRRPHAKSTS